MTQITLRTNQDITGNSPTKKPLLVRMAEERRRKEDTGIKTARAPIAAPSQNWQTEKIPKTSLGIK